jgi:ubiquinone/menaquinone biosynthesis C-methylase UbiE
MDYYKHHYTMAQRSGLQGWGNTFVDREVEKRSIQRPNAQVLEIGASSGEHRRFVRQDSSLRTYVALDLEPRVTNPILASALESRNLLDFVQGDAAALPFQSNSFDLTLSTCVLAHVNDPESVFFELRRVTKPGGVVVVGMPCDPGIFNRLVKILVTYRSMKHAGVSNPRLSYAREHVNPVGNLLELAKHVFQEDDLRFSYYPFWVPSWNVNLVVTLQAIKRGAG